MGNLVHGDGNQRLLHLLTPERSAVGDSRSTGSAHDWNR
jgi:hypothetical protein